MSTTFLTRMATAFDYEQVLADDLRARGWQVLRIGMGVLPEAMRNHLINWRDSYGWPSRWRWMPDLLVTTDRFGRPRCYMVDAKTLESETLNYSIELDAVETYQAIENCLHIPVLMVGEGRVLTPHIAFNRYFYRSDGSGANGSKTAFILVKKIYAEPMANFFGAPSEPTVT
jgi:hypothetical protein